MLQKSCVFCTNVPTSLLSGDFRNWEEPDERIAGRRAPGQSWSETRRGSWLLCGWPQVAQGEMTASRAPRGEQILWRVCFVPDTMWESFMAGLIYYPMKQINGEEMKWAAAKILQWLAHWTLRTATQRRWMWVLQLWWWSLSCKLSRQIYNGVFTESHASDQSCSKKIFAFFVSQKWKQMVSGPLRQICHWPPPGYTSQLMAGICSNSQVDFTINDLHGDNITRRVVNDIIQAI